MNLLGICGHQVFVQGLGQFAAEAALEIAELHHRYGRAGRADLGLVLHLYLGEAGLKRILRNVIDGAAHDFLAIFRDEKYLILLGVAGFSVKRDLFEAGQLRRLRIADSHLDGLGPDKQMAHVGFESGLVQGTWFICGSLRRRAFYRLWHGDTGCQCEA